MNDIYIIDGVRTPIGAYLGQYKKTESVELGTQCLLDLFQRCLLYTSDAADE